jgi:RNA polymerase sigma factor (sigma-70 family)
MQQSKYDLQSIMQNAWHDFKSSKFSSFSLSLTNAWRVEKEKINITPNNYINSPEFIQTLNKYAIYAKHKFFSGEHKEVNEIINDLFIVSHNALSKYNHEKGTLKTYLYTRIRGYLLDCLRNKKRTQLPVFNIDEAQETNEGSEPYDFISFYAVNKLDDSAKETLDTLGEYVKQIPGRAVDVYSLIRQGYNLKETGKKLNLSESRVCQIVQKIKGVANKNKSKILC